MKQKLRVLGMMSGTSLDGVDFFLCDFWREEEIKFEPIAFKTIPYNRHWQKVLRNAVQLSLDETAVVDMGYGLELAQMTQRFLKDLSTPDIISSHGHTIFHNPQEGFTKQIGNGPELFDVLKIPVVCDFRTQDVELGGQGAPLVPIGDRLLFSNFDACINLGGFSNISFEDGPQRIAFDICPVNVVLNYLSRKLGKQYDEGGKIARKGKVNADLFNHFNQLDYYKKGYPKSLGIEWVEQEIFPILESSEVSTIDLLATWVEHVGHIISDVLNQFQIASCLLSGGGVYNEYLIEILKGKTSAQIEIPPKWVIEFKEALIFGLLGYLKWHNEINVLSSVTGAVKNHSSGVIYR